MDDTTLQEGPLCLRALKVPSMGPQRFKVWGLGIIISPILTLMAQICAQALKSWG